MKVTILKEIEFNAKTIQVSAYVRYWEDATINGEPDEHGELTPFADGQNWNPHIDIDAGKIIGWPANTVAELHFKVCDGFSAIIIDDKGAVIIQYSGYVPNTMCPEGGGFGDYLIMKIDKDGNIRNWNFNIHDFTNED